MRNPNLFWIAVAIILGAAILPWQKHTTKVIAYVEASALSQDQQNQLAETPLCFPMKTSSGDTIFIFGESLKGFEPPFKATWYQSPIHLTKTKYFISR
ncbi:MAG: hypothetical protein KBC17_01380 [Candidatus Pacebacteria bacterium]|nr:hypothetical protein [Candidatus Paceibacterota bacterium]